MEDVMATSRYANQTPDPRAQIAAAYDWDLLVQDERVHRLVYTAPDIFEAEMTNIFGGVWTYLGHESQIPNADDYITMRLGHRPLIVLRDTNGQLRALFNRCTHRGATLCRDAKGKAKVFQCAYHGWTYMNTGELRGVPWREGYACDFKDARFNLAQVPRVESYRGFIFGTLNPAMPPLEDYLGPVRKPIDEWLDRHPGSRVVVREANRLKFKGNWKLAYDNSADGYHVKFSHRSLLDTENRLKADNEKGMSFYKDRPDDAPMYVQYMGHGHHFKDKRPNVEKRPGALWEIEGAAPGMEYFEEEMRRRLGDQANGALDLAASEPVNINVFPNLLILGNHIQVIEPVSVTETNTTWYGTAIVDDDDTLGGTLDLVNQFRMRTQEGFPNFGEVDDATNFEEIQRGLACVEDEWVYMHRGLGLPERYTTEADGTIKAPATDEVFMRETFKEWKRLMAHPPVTEISRQP
jgi:phenylpropionate dioxygenase-like ring-hydroxylating dioxygenase large terminal subunit